MNQNIRNEMLAEAFGTFILMVFGLGSVAQSVLSGNSNPLSIHLSWGLAVTVAIFCCRGACEAHLNPAVTLALAIFKDFPLRKIPFYLLAQFTGAFLASVTVFAVYREAFDRFDGGIRMLSGAKATAGIFATYPQVFLSNFPGGFIDQTVGTALLVAIVFALADKRNLSSGNWGPVLIGTSVALIGMCFGYNAGYPINPARDLAPRIFTALAGWGGEVFTAHDSWWWVPVLAPLFGGLVGGAAWVLCLPPEKRERRALSLSKTPEFP